MQQLKKQKIVVIAFNDCLTSSLLGILDVLEMCNQFWKMENPNNETIFQTEVVSVDGEIKHSFNAFPINPTKSMEKVTNADIIIIPPIMHKITAVLAENQLLIPWLIKMHTKGALIASVCTGAFFLAQTGLLNGKRATTNPMIADTFRSKYPKIDLDLDHIVVIENQLITSGPTYAFIDLVVFIIEKYVSAELALTVSKLLLHDKNRNALSSYLLPSLKMAENDEEILKIQKWIKVNAFDRGINLDNLANRFHMSSRNLTRRFQKATGITPLHYLQTLRVEKAKALLEKTQKSLEEVTHTVGYADSKSFARLFKKQINLSPSEYRKRFSSRVAVV